MSGAEQPAGTRFQPGELVNVHILGARYDSTHPDGDHMVVYGENFFINIPAGAVIEQVAAKEWPPQSGDVWADGDNSEWFTFAARNKGGITLRPASDMAFWVTPDDLLANHGPMRLVRRRGWTPDRPPPDCCPDVEADPGEVGGETVEDAEATS